MTNEEFVKQTYSEATVSLNSHAYIDGFADIPYEIIVCSPLQGSYYPGPIQLAVDHAAMMMHGP
jgi:hypothetical protein